MPESAYLMGMLVFNLWSIRAEFKTGVVDETNSLAEGQVFCQIHPPDAEPQIIKGRCTIYRNPCRKLTGRMTFALDGTNRCHFSASR